MTYFDSDGVIYDFNYWVDFYDPSAFDRPLGVDSLMVNHYDTVFLKGRKTRKADYFINRLVNDEECFVLSAVPSVERLYSEFPEIGKEEIEKRVNTMMENKKLWFESHGVPREKVILVTKAAHKARYCKSKNDTLYDDWMPNISRWIEKGGNGVLVEQH